MPNRGDKLYHCWDGELESVTFIEETIADGAYAPTWLVRGTQKYDGTMFSRRIRCSIGSYFTSEKAAWEAELADQKQGLIALRKQRAVLVEKMAETRGTIIELRKKVTSV